MKKIILVLCLVPLVSLSARAEKLCAIGGGTWSTTFSATTSGWTGGATAYHISGLGSTGATTPTWRAQHTKNGVTTVISGIHKCSDQGFLGDAVLADNNGQYCYCKRTLVNGAASAGIWVFRSDKEVNSECSNSCASGCADRIVNYIGVRTAILATPIP